LDSLQQKLVNLTEKLEHISGLKPETLGVTGSLLLDIHNPEFSDIDITVYGTKNSWKLKNAITKQGTNAPIKRLDGKQLEEWSNKKTADYPVTAKEASLLYERKWNLGRFQNTWVSIHPVKSENELTEKYGQKTFTPEGQVTIRATVSDNTDSLFLPAVYKITDVEFLEGTETEPVTEVAAYETLYDSLAENGETIQVKGKLEKVQENNQHHYRVLVGSAEGKGKEYIKRIK
jgi:predicted nucleotidyltransferase